MPYVSQVAVGKLDCLNVWGNDYPTPDGTGVRDYIHVSDLALGHLAADWSARTGGGGAARLQPGTGRGYSVLEMVAAFERAERGRSRCRTASRRAVPATWPPATPTRRWRASSSTGLRSGTWTRCAATPGTGSRRIRAATDVVIPAALTIGDRSRTAPPLAVSAQRETWRLAPAFILMPGGRDLPAQPRVYASPCDAVPRTSSREDRRRRTQHGAGLGCIAAGRYFEQCAGQQANLQVTVIERYDVVARCTCSSPDI